MDLRRWTARAWDEVERWQAGFGGFGEHPSTSVGEAEFAAAFGDLVERLRESYPFHHPRYQGQMLKPPHPAAMVGYLAAMRINPNNHALDGGPATSRMEQEATGLLGAMFGMPDALGHLTSSGTIANLEALFVARETRPGRAVAFSSEAHYTHSRMCRLLGVPAVQVPVDAAGRLDVPALDALMSEQDIGTVVVTAGSTALGAVDPIDEVLALREKHDFRVHVDAAYGGFFALIADDSSAGVSAAPFRAIADCDSVVVDPHKHGLQPYGCGAVLFADPEVARFYRHDSPYTYFTTDEPHLGEISLECSKSGAAAAALWLTFQVLPPTPDGLGQVLRASRRAALRWSGLLADSAVLSAYQQPELDIVGLLPNAATMSEVDKLAERAMTGGMQARPQEQLHLAVLEVTAEDCAARGHTVHPDVPRARILRSVLMKPEHEDWVEHNHSVLERLLS
ncbi:MAG: aspartate aminotransferase family protein [Saccharopolyspora sp.]|uniref:pyridoxal phosphate-dependent decarboxylase family protein n=1 Tax=Saccharopolyspora sp. TaxID=33915 RepID=UPI0025F347EC|nr:aminotransferase class I/II-fold pyridoxal phosphate-dependent enzyme [Saccharopolyspora sp.]MBQ6640087.1 aspartate aminotransferase family protein [Saccharopolyspora sp.]